MFCNYLKSFLQLCHARECFFVHLKAFIYSFLLQTFILHFCVCSVLATDKRYGQSLTLVNFASNRPSPCSFLQFCLSGLQVHVLLKCSVWCVWCDCTEAVSSHCTSWITFAVWIIMHIWLLWSQCKLCHPLVKLSLWGPPSQGSFWTVRILCPHCVTTVCGSTSLLCTEKASDSTGTELEPLLKFPFFMVLN